MAERKQIVVLDPAHGGTSDCGGSSWQGGASPGPNSIVEKDITLALAKAVKDRLDATHTVTLTRDRDVNVSLSERAQRARELEADLFVSIHFNAALDPDVDGTESWVANRASPPAGRWRTRLRACWRARRELPTGARESRVRRAVAGAARSAHRSLSRRSRVPDESRRGGAPAKRTLLRAARGRRLGNGPCARRSRRRSRLGRRIAQYARLGDTGHLRGPGRQE